VALDTLGALVTFLKADPDVASASVGRIFPGELPRNENPSMPRAAVVVKRAGGGLLGTAYQEYGDIRVDVDCYGKTMREADQLYSVTRRALKQMNREVSGGILFHWARISSDGVGLTDPETDWAMCIGSFQVLVAEVSAY
jgi:hypothetical protein